MIEETETLAPCGKPLHTEIGAGRMRALLIDPVLRTVTEGFIDPGLCPMYAAIGCSTIDIVSLASGSKRSIDLIIDDEGLFGGTHFFRVAGHNIAGRALVLDSDADGKTIGTGLPLSWLIRAIEWL